MASLGWRWKLASSMAARLPARIVRFPHYDPEKTRVHA
jgi:hypothetical protein